MLNYKSCTIEIQRIWNVTLERYKKKIGTNETIFKIARTIPEQHNGKTQNQELQKTVILGTADILRKVLI